MVIGGRTGNTGTMIDQSISAFERESLNLIVSTDGQLKGKLNDMEKIKNLVENIKTLGQMQNEGLVRCSILSRNIDELNNCNHDIILTGDMRIKQFSDIIAKRI